MLENGTKASSLPILKKSSTIDVADNEETINRCCGVQ